MFANFIYLIIAILIYAVYQPTDSPAFSASEAWLLAAGLAAGFAVLSRLFFQRLETALAHLDAYRADDRHSTLQTRQSIMAIALFAVMIHGLGLPSSLAGWLVFQKLPTLLAVVFLGLFLLLLSIVWYQAYPSYRRLYGAGLSRRTYVVSNWRMSVPILIPWVMISLLSDIIFALPFEAPKRFLSTTGGEIVFFVGFLVFVAAFAPLIIQRFWGCYPLEAGYYRERIQALCRRAGIGYRNIVYWPIFGGRMLTAGVMGIVRKFRYILVTEALLRALTPEEVDAVIAHEIGHVKKHHLLYYIFFMACFMLIVFAVYDVSVYLILFADPLLQAVLKLGVGQETLLWSLHSAVFLAAFLIYFRFIFGYFMRTFERQADVFVFSLFDTARPMISTFHKIALTSGQSPDKPNWHHYSIRERIDYLLKCEGDRRWVDRHNRKVRFSMLFFAAAMLGIGLVGYQLNFGVAGQKIRTNFFEEILQKKIAQAPDDPQLYSLLGDLQYSRKAYRETAQAYERAIALAPEDVQVLNNLAWLYATCEDESIRNPRRAVELARRAAALDPAPHVLDTLAESYFANGELANAVHFARRAVEQATDKQAYYQSQLERFQKAEGKGERIKDKGARSKAKGGKDQG
jgi:Zn-dependent protease with chaperone function